MPGLYPGSTGLTAPPEHGEIDLAQAIRRPGERSSPMLTAGDLVTALSHQHQPDLSLLNQDPLEGAVNRLVLSFQPDPLMACPVTSTAADARQCQERPSPQAWTPQARGLL